MKVLKANDTRGLLEHVFSISRGTIPIAINIAGAVWNSVGKIRITQSQTLVKVEWFSMSYLQRDITKVYGTSRISKHMIKKNSWMSFSIQNWFVPDLVDILKNLIESHKTRGSKSAYRGLINALEEHTWISSISAKFKPKMDYDRIESSMDWSLLDHQRRFLEFYDETTQRYNFTGQLLAAAPGAGKTFAGLALAEGTHSDVVIIISPKNALHRVWETTIKERYHEEQSLWMSDGKDELDVKNTRFMVMNYEYLTKFNKQVSKSSFRGKKVLVILDESHNFNSGKAVRTNQFLELVKASDAKNTLLLSGTPIKASSLEFITMFRAIDPMFTDKVEAAFKKVYAGRTQVASYLLERRYKTLSFIVEKSELELTEPKVRTFQIKFKGSENYTLKNVREDMLKFIEERVKFFAKTKKEDRELFDSIIAKHAGMVKGTAGEAEFNTYHRYLMTIIKTNFYMDIGELLAYCNKYEKDVLIPSLSSKDAKTFKDIKSQVKYVELKIRGEALGRVLAKARTDAHVELVKHADLEGIINGAKKKTVIFSNNIRVCEQVIVETANFAKPIGVFGQYTKDLTKRVGTFMNVEEVNPMVATYASLSTAVPLTAANNVIVVDVPFRAHTLDQAISRVHRLGQDENTVVNYLRLDTGEELNISDRSVDILTWAAEEVERLTGVVSPVVLDDTEVAVESEDVLIQYDTGPIYTNWSQAS